MCYFLYFIQFVVHVHFFIWKETLFLFAKNVFPPLPPPLQTKLYGVKSVFHEKFKVNSCLWINVLNYLSKLQTSSLEKVSSNFFFFSIIFSFQKSSKTLEGISGCFVLFCFFLSSQKGASSFDISFLNTIASDFDHADQILWEGYSFVSFFIAV